jgi:hypothetical protein
MSGGIEFYFLIAFLFSLPALANTTKWPSSFTKDNATYQIEISLE